ncbi:hypothetical protein [Mongoliibacter ruber]|uniref:Phage portal protein n=1 Tax=Mongoliibacter ruber TaxID=1750599 RepID=A0A2T0WV58_9BACT|nr:hypothetical protein [Mongoliibacter ruber]PRY90575.1 hypothetical protein CLW00_101238 [Mongoliibacter ruber]
MVEPNINQDASITYFEGGPVLFSSPGINHTKPVKKKPSDGEEMESQIIAEWGENNDFPIQARNAKEGNPDLVSALDWRARALYAGGLNYILRDRHTKKDLRDDPKFKEMVFEIDQFKFRNRHYLAQASVDFYDLNNVFAQIIISEDREKITRIAAAEAKNCRYKRRNSAGDLTHAFIHPDWEEWRNTEKDEKLTKLEVIDTLNSFPEELKEQEGGALRYIYPVNYPTGKNYYQHPFWWAVKQSKWLDFTNMIPEAKAAIVRNMARIQYHIEMPDYWMSERYKNWGTMKDEEKKKAIVAEFKIINDVLHKPENHGKSVYTMFKTFTQSGKEYGGWKITAVDDKMKDGALLADSSEGVMKILSANSIDPSLHGMIPGKGGSNRSGSDKREALNIYMSLTQVHEDIVLDPWQYASWWNKWNTEDHECLWYTNKPHLQTLNQVSPSQRETTLEQHAD